MRDTLTAVFGALLLASTYLAIGLCVSARTDNQVVALLLTLVVGGALYLVGADALVSLATQEQGELLRQIGSGARFESIERGVLDLRDLVYYGSLTAFFLVLNGFFLEHPRLDAGAPAGRTRALQLQLGVALVGLNALAALGGNPAPFPGAAWGEADPRIAEGHRQVRARQAHLPAPTQRAAPNLAGQTP